MWVNVFARSQVLTASLNDTALNLATFTNSYADIIDFYAPNKVLSALKVSGLEAIEENMKTIANAPTTFSKGYTDLYETVHPLEVNNVGVASLTTIYPYSSGLTTDEKAALVAAIDIRH